MTDQSTATEQPAATATPTLDPQARATELAILDALRSVVDPEIGMNVVELALIKQVILGEELALPRIEPRGAESLTTPRNRYTGIRQAGPESLRHFKRTYKRALKRQIASGIYDPHNPIVVPIREDKLYRSWNPIYLPQTNAEQPPLHASHDPLDRDCPSNLPRQS